MLSNLLISKQLVNYLQPPQKQAQHSPFKPNRIHYGKKSDEIQHKEPTPALNKEEKNYIQQVVGSFLHYARAIDMTILFTLSNIASKQANPTKKTIKRVSHLLYYMAIRSA